MIQPKPVSTTNVIPEVVTALLMTSMGIENLGLPLTCWLFLVNAVLLRFVWNSAMLIHGLGHVLLTATVDRNFSFIRIFNILENRTLADTFKSLIPLSPIFIPLINNGPCPWVEAGNVAPLTIRVKALGGILFNIIALEIVPLLLANSFDLRPDGDAGTFVSQFLGTTFVSANLLTAFSSLSDIAAFLTGVADCFNCGNFGFLGSRNPDDGSELLPQRVVEMFAKMGRETEIRGEQAGGGLVSACNKANHVVFVGKKILNKKRGNLTKSLEAAFAPVRRKALLEGKASLESVVMGMWHYRYATSSPPAILETHWHEWMPARQAAVWQVENGQWVCESKNVNHRITHNGDFDAWMIFGKLIENAKLGLWLERVLHTPNATIGDSPKIAGMMDLLITQGMWDASVRLAYQLEVAESIKAAFGGQVPAKDAPNTAPSQRDLSGWAEIFERIFQKHSDPMRSANASSMLDEFAEHSSLLEKDTLQEISQNSSVSQWTWQQKAAFVRTAIQAFLHNDLYRATKLFISRAKGSFGLVTASTLDQKSLVLSSQGQPMAIGCNSQSVYKVYASEPAAVDSVLSGIPQAYRLDLDQKAGEVAWVSPNKLTVYSIAKGYELLEPELQERLTPIPANPYLQLPEADTKDLVENDIKEIAPLLKEIEAAWKNPSSWNCQSAEHLANLLIAKAQGWAVESKGNTGLVGELQQLRTVDLLITGIENSLWLSEQFAQDLTTLFPLLNVKALSANQVLKLLQRDVSSLGLGKNAIALAISQSGQTFPTLQATNALDQLRRQGFIGELFIMTGEPDSLMGSAIGQRYFSGAAFSCRIFTNGSGRRTAEPSTLAVAAAQATLTELLFYLTNRIRQAPNRNPLGMTLTADSLSILEAIKDDFLNRSTVAITGTTARGVAIQSPENQKLISSGRKWALHVTETPLTWGIHALYTLITVGWVIPFGYTVPLAQTIFRLIFFLAELPIGLLVLATPVITLVDIAIYIFGPYLWTLGLRYCQGRQLLARLGNRTLVIGDVPWVHQLLKSYVSKLFSLSYGIASLEVHGSNPQDHMVHDFGHRVTRGTLVFLGVPDGRRSQMQKKDENAVIMTGKQASGVRNVGVGPEIIALGHNPAIAQQGLNDAIILGSHTDSLLAVQEVDHQAVIEELRESRFGSFERLLASYVLFWAMAKKVAAFPLLGYQHWKSQSRTRIATTAAPVSGVNLDLLGATTLTETAPASHQYPPVATETARTPSANPVSVSPVASSKPWSRFRFRGPSRLLVGGGIALALVTGGIYYAQQPNSLIAQRVESVVKTPKFSLAKTLPGHTNSVWSVAVSSNGRTLVSGSEDKTIKAWNLETGQLRYTLSGHADTARSVALSADGQTLASGSGDKTIKLWNLQTGKLRRTLEGHSGPVWSVALSPDGQTLVSGGEDNAIKIWHLQTGELRRLVFGHSGRVFSVAISPDGQTLATGSADKTVKLWNLPTGELRGTLEGHTDAVRSVVFSPDGGKLASSSWDGTVKLWNSRTGERLHTLQGHGAQVVSAAFSPDGQTLASASLDRTIKIWDLQTGSPRRTLSSHSDWVLAVATSPTGQTLVTSSKDKTIKLWQ